MAQFQPPVYHPDKQTSLDGHCLSMCIDRYKASFHQLFRISFTYLWHSCYNYTFMESRRHLRVLPSNAPNLSESDAIHRSPTQSLELDRSLQTCPDFNNDIDCRICGLQHACSNCLQEDHGARACKKRILRVSSGNVGSIEPVTSLSGSKVEVHEHYTTKASTALMRGSDHLAHVALRLDQRRSRRGLDSRHKLPLYYRAELQSPRYIAYREKARSKGSKNQTWPDNVEEAFQRGSWLTKWYDLP